MSDEQEGVSSRQLLAAFFAVVVLCAVFFSLGFFLGHKEGSAASRLATEQVPSSSDAPAAVNSPTQPSESDASSAAAAIPGDAARDPGRAAPPPSGSPTSPATSSAAETAGPTGPTHDEPSTASAVRPTTAQPVVLQASTGGPAKKIPPGVLVQVAALGNQQDANNMVSVLQSRGYPALILTSEQAHAGDNLFRVVAGPYKTRAESEKARSKLLADGFKPFIRP